MFNLMTFNYYGFNLPNDLANLTGAGEESFKKISDNHINNLKKYIGLQPYENLFEFGCGVGRDAIPLSQFLTTGTYLGIDIIKPSIDWCKKNVTTKYPNIKFEHLDAKDQIHNPKGKSPFQLLNFPASDESIDKAFAFSVFTHLFESDIIHSLKEINRILKPGGLAYLTCFKVNPKIIKASQDNQLTPFDLNFEYKLYDDCFISNPAYPTSSVGFTKSKLYQMISKSGLELKCDILNGGWSGFYEGCTDGQDVLILEKI